MLRYVLAGLLLATTAQAQISPTSPTRQRADNRRDLREAHHANLPYQDSHLSVTRRQLRRGTTTPLRAADEPRFDHRGRPRKARTGFLGWGRRPKNEPKR